MSQENIMHISNTWLCYNEPDKLKFYLPGGPQVKFLILGDAHCKFDDDRGIPYQKYTDRMKRCSPHMFSLVEEAIAKASVENKHILIECHTDGCVPCKMMKEKVFTHDKCAEYLNREFVCISIDDEHGEGPQIIEKFNVQMYPTYIILEPDGELSGILMAAETDIDCFIEKIEQIKNNK